MPGTFSRFSPQNQFNSPNHRRPFMIDTESIERASEEVFALYVSFDMYHSLRYVSMGNTTTRALKLSAPPGEGLAAPHPWIHQHRPSCPDRKGL
jgi:hypothetical protein